MKVVIVPVADRPECKIALDQAFRLADAISSSVIGCHLRPHRSENPKKRRPDLRFRFARFTAHKGKANTQTGQLKSKHAKNLFLQRAAEHDFQLVKQPRLGIERAAIWLEMVGALDKLFPIIGPVADMSVVSRPLYGTLGPAPDFLLSALLHSAKPVLVLPQRPLTSLGEHVLIAWNQSAPAARAVSAALPLLQNAASVHICTCGPTNRAGPTSKGLEQYLKFWVLAASAYPPRDETQPQSWMTSMRKRAAICW